MVAQVPSVKYSHRMILEGRTGGQIGRQYNDWLNNGEYLVVIALNKVPQPIKLLFIPRPPGLLNLSLSALCCPSSTDVLLLMGTWRAEQGVRDRRRGLAQERVSIK